MQYGICNLSVIPLRAQASERSEMVSQVLFGETFEILEWQEGWVRIVTALDKYEGWVGALQFNMLGHIAYRTLRMEPPQLTNRAVTQAWKVSDNSVAYLPIGSSLSFLTGTLCTIGSEKWEIVGEMGELEPLAVTAKSFLNTPYLWGGRTHYGIDCSGFTQAVLRLHGVNVRRDASQQVEQGTLVENLKQTQLGDLAFFENPQGKITHVGILLGNGEIIHASGRVKIDTIDDEGIYSAELKRYTHKLRAVKRFL